MNVASAETFSGGFSNPVFDGQRIFRRVMKAMAEPGLIVECPSHTAPPHPLLPSAAGVLCTLCDADTSIFIDASSSKDHSLVDWIRFHTDAPIRVASALSDFALILNAETMPTLDHFLQGTADYPDRSTTLIVQVKSLTGGPVFTLKGPGIETTRTFAPTGLPDHFPASWRNNCGLYPRGVDIIFATDDLIASMPRSTQIVGEVAPCM